MNEARVAKLNEDMPVNRGQLQKLQQAVDAIYASGLIVEVHSVIGDTTTYEIELIDRPSTSVQINKKILPDGTERDWEVIDLKDYGNGRKK